MLKISKKIIYLPLNYKKQHESKGSEKLKQIGVVAPAKQLEKGQLTNYFNNKK